MEKRIPAALLYVLLSQVSRHYWGFARREADVEERRLCCVSLVLPNID